MHDMILKPGWETVLFAVPFIGMLLVGIFRLDEIFCAPRQRVVVRRPVCGVDESGQPLMTDPDGRQWRAPRRRR